MLKKLCSVIFIQSIFFVFVSTYSEANNDLANAIKYSDNFEFHKEVFIKYSQKILNSGKCSMKDFRENGGWAKATGSNAQKPVYFIYCGGFTLKDKLYLNISNGKVWK